MHILIGYGYYPGTTGVYLESAAAKQHKVTYVGTPYQQRSGFPANFDVAQYISGLEDKPDLFLYIDSGNTTFFPSGLEKLSCPSAAFLVDAYPPGIATRNPVCELLAPHFDYLFIAHQAALNAYNKFRGQDDVQWLPVACDPAIYQNDALPKIFEVGFVGQYNKNYPQRVRILDALSSRYTMNDFRRPIYFNEMARVYQQSKIVVNISHTSHILNLRFFEATAAGALLITEKSNTNGQNNLLHEGKQFIAFTQLEELLNSVKYYLQHEEERECIAKSAQQTVLTHHTYDNRFDQMLKHISATHGTKNAPCRRWDSHQIANRRAAIYANLRLMDATFTSLEGSRGTRSRIRQIFYTASALLRRIKHEWK